MPGEWNRLRPVSVEMEGTRIPPKVQRTGRHGIGYCPCHHDMIGCFTRLRSSRRVAASLNVFLTTGMTSNVFG